MSAERALLIRTAFSAENGRYFAVGMDFPSARVFDTATGELCCVVEPERSKLSNATVLRSTGSLSGTAFAVSLSCLLIGAVPSTKKGDVGTLLVAGLSDGTVVIHSITKDVRLAHVAVSDAQQAVLAVAIRGEHLYCLTKGGKLWVLEAHNGQLAAGPFDVPKTSTHVSVSIAGDYVLVGGPTSAIYRIVPSAGKDSLTLETVLTFATQATPVNFSWIANDGRTAVTCGAQEGMVRVWDISLGDRSSAVCKRTLIAGHRVGNMRVRPGSDDATAMISVTTFLGQVLLWELGNTLAPRIADPVPLEPTVICVSAIQSGKILVGDINPETNQLLTVRGRFAVPRFEARGLQDIMSKSADGAVCKLPLLSNGAQASESNQLEVAALDLDNEWASHHAVATRALVTAPEDFAIPKSFHAASVAHLPTSSMSIEAQERQEHATRTVRPSAVGLGSITVPLYQALHAGDESLVMELMSVSSRGENEIKNCVVALQLPYVLHLLKILSKRVHTSSTRSPVFQWISTIVQLRGAEMFAAQVSDVDAATGDAPRVFVAPLLAQYRSMTAQYDKIATACGRLSIFRSVNPTEATLKRNLINTETAVADGIMFPKTFRLIDRAGSDAPKVVRTRSKLEHKAIAARRKRIKKPRRENNVADDASGDDLDDDELSLNSEEMDAMMMDEDITLDSKSKKSRSSAGNLIADDGAIDDDKEDDEDFDSESDDLIDSDEEDEDAPSEVDSSPYEEGEEDEESEKGEGADDDEGSEDDGEDESDDGEEENYSLRARRGAHERTLRVD